MQEKKAGVVGARTGADEKKGAIMKRAAWVTCVVLAIAVLCAVVMCRRHGSVSSANGGAEAGALASVSTSGTAPDMAPAVSEEFVKFAEEIANMAVESPQGDIVEQARIKQQARAAEVQDELAFVRENPDSPEREQMLEFLDDKCMEEAIVGADAAYVMMELNALLTRKYNKYELALISRAMRYFLRDAMCDDAAKCIKGAIEALQNEDYDFGQWNFVDINTPEAKAAAVQMLREKLKYVEERRARFSDAPSPSTDDAPVDMSLMPGYRVPRPHWGPEERAVADSAEVAAEAKNYPKAISLYLSIGDKENAAAVLLSKSRGASLDEGLATIAEVVESFPGTRQAELALFHKAELERNAGHADACQDTLKDYLAQYPDGVNAVEALFRLAWDAESSGRLEEAIAHLERGIKIMSEKDRSYSETEVLRLALLYERVGQPVKGEALLSESIAQLERGDIHIVGDHSDLAKLRAIQGLTKMREAMTMKRTFQERMQGNGPDRAGASLPPAQPQSEPAPGP